nr:HAD hydrolase family protein [Lacticaseibacillus pantheris]
MIDFVDHGVAMGNALPEVKAVADYITADYNRGGIVQGLRHLGLIG